MSGPVPVSIKRLVLDVMAQPRVSTRDAVVSEYGERMQAGDEFPPAVAFTDGKTTWLADGWHRYAAALGTGASTLLCEVREGGLRDAILYACGANDTHGLKRTNEDKRKAVKTLLDDEEWRQWSDREIARICRVNHELVGSLRPVTGGTASKEEADDDEAEPVPRKRRYRTKHGTVDHVIARCDAQIEQDIEANKIRKILQDDIRPIFRECPEIKTVGKAIGELLRRRGVAAA